MKSKEFLIELANAPYDYVLTKKINDVTEYKFQTDAEVMYTVRFMRTGDEMEIGFGAQVPGKKPTMDITNTGDAFRVFGTVKEILRSYLASVSNHNGQPPLIVFSGKGSDPSRIKLYDRIANSIPKWIQGYKLSNVNDHDGSRYYELKRNVS